MPTQRKPRTAEIAGDRNLRRQGGSELHAATGDCRDCELAKEERRLARRQDEPLLDGVSTQRNA
eukprot:6184163-Pleurochrysis_carterae.AAC.4